MRYRLTFQIFPTLGQARKFMKSRKGRKATLTPWSSHEGREKGYIVWYYT